MINRFPNSDPVPCSSLIPDTSAVPIYNNDGTQLAETENVPTPMPQSRSKVVSTTPKLTATDFSGLTLDVFLVNAYEVDLRNDNFPVQTKMMTRTRGHNIKDISASIL